MTLQLSRLGHGQYSRDGNHTAQTGGNYRFISALTPQPVMKNQQFIIRRRLMGGLIMFRTMGCLMQVITVALVVLAGHHLTAQIDGAPL